ncbi:MAG: uracil-DNA glycosylase family protein [Hyphomicrobiales bacterium]
MLAGRGAGPRRRHPGQALQRLDARASSSTAWRRWACRAPPRTATARCSSPTPSSGGRPRNRTPTEAETQMLPPFLPELQKPDVIVCLGATPAHRLTGRSDGILKLRGRWVTATVSGRNIPLLPTLHPAYLPARPEAAGLARHAFAAPDARRALRPLQGGLAITISRLPLSSRIGWCFMHGSGEGEGGFVRA